MPCPCHCGKRKIISDGISNYTWMDAIYPYAKNGQIYICPSDPGWSSNWPYQYAGGSSNIGSYEMNAVYWNQMTDSLAPTLTLNPFSATYSPPSSLINAILDDGNHPTWGYTFIAKTSEIANPATIVQVVEDGTYVKGTGSFWNMLFAPRSLGATYGSATVTTTPPVCYGSTAPSSMPVFAGGASACNSWCECNNVALRHSGTANVLYCDGHVKSSNFGALTTLNANGALQYFIAGGG